MTLPNYTGRCFCLILILALVAFTATLGEEDTPDFSKNGALFLEQYCFSCHAGDQPAAELSLDSYTDNHSLIKEREVWDRVLDMVETTQMPPADSEQPPMEELESFVAHIDAIFEHADRTAKPDPGRITVRRLNKVENTEIPSATCSVSISILPKSFRQMMSDTDLITLAMSSLCHPC